jgi:hypothetical protein
MVVSRCKGRCSKDECYRRYMLKLLDDELMANVQTKYGNRYQPRP